MPRPLNPFTFSALIICAAFALALPGCSGCWNANAKKDDTSEKDKDDQKDKDGEDKEKEKPKPDFEFAQLKVLPGDNSSAVKPGHWIAVSQQMKANNFNFNGELTSAAVDKFQNPLNLERTAYRMQMSRPASLPKGQAKHLEMTVFIPRRESRQSPRPQVMAKLQARGSGRTVTPASPNPTFSMESHQYFLVALSRTPDSYAYLKTLNTVRPPRGDFGGPLTHYRIDLPQLNKRVPLPSNPLMWTSIAFVLWDDIDPDLLSIDQQDALIDWIHWGGGLIISGPGSMETLRSSFLADYLPGVPKETVKLPQSRFAELNENFTLPLNGGVTKPLTIIENQQPEGLEFKLADDAHTVPKSGGLVVQRRVGRGRIAITSFALTHPQIVNWSGFDNFFNACLLRRPGRQFYPNIELGEVGVRFSDPNLSHRFNDPRLVSHLRYFTRDMGFLRQTASRSRTQTAQPRTLEEVFTLENAEALLNEDSGSVADGLDESRFELPTVGDEADQPVVVAPWNTSEDLLTDRGFHAAPQSGVAGWNDLSGSSDAARRALKQAAGITVPKRDFVLRIVGIYLLVLVPLNWGFFRLIGRVEWAWVAAPIIAIAGGYTVIRMAELDIGFARSRTELAVLEMQGSHHRGHLTRYTALYTSLSTGYSAQFDSPTAVSQPFARDPDYEKLRGQSSSTVEFRSEKQQVGLRGYRVQSNSTGMLHSEEMRNLGGGLKLTGDEASGWQIVNDSDMLVKDVGILRRVEDPAFDDSGELQVAWIGELRPRTKVPVRFGSSQDSRALLTGWQESEIMTTKTAEGEVSLVRLLDLARDPRRIFPGDVKLIGWTDEEVEGLDITPRASQSLYRTLVIAHLQYSDLPTPTPDSNTFQAAKARAQIGGGS